MSARVAAAVAAAALLALPGAARTAGAQHPSLVRALDLEQRGRLREAAAAFRQALPRVPAPAMLGYERVMMELGEIDTLLAVLDSATGTRPYDATFRTIGLRTLHAAGRRDQERAAFERWAAQASPRDAAPYREYARLLLHAGESAAADTIIERARRALGDTREFAVEAAQIRASLGRWQDAAETWRSVVETSGYLEQAAVFSLARADTAGRARIRRALGRAPVTLGARRLLAQLELTWGSATAAWEAVRTLPPDSGAVRAWVEIAQRAEQLEAWLTARDAYAAVNRHQFSIGSAMRAAAASLEGRDPAAALAFATLAASRIDSAAAAVPLAPIIVRALAELGRPADAEATARAYEAWLDAVARDRLRRIAAWAWIRAGDVPRARRLLAAAAPTEEADEISAWLALYEGDLAGARAGFRSVRGTAPATVRAMAILSRTRTDTGPTLGLAFLTLARGDTNDAVGAFERAAASLPDAASVLLLYAAQLGVARGDDLGSERLLARVVTEHANSPDAPEAELAWARSLARRGDLRGAAARLEHLILSYPSSALVPQARRELDALTGRRPDRT